MNRLKDRVAIVTGSTAGIGFAIAERFLKEGARVVITSRKSSNVREAVDRLGDSDRVLGVPCHVGKAKERDDLVRRTVEKWGLVDILVNNAAVSPAPGALMDISESVWDKLFDVVRVARIGTRGLPGLLTFLDARAGARAEREIRSDARAKVRPTHARRSWCEYSLRILHCGVQSDASVSGVRSDQNGAPRSDQSVGKRVGKRRYSRQLSRARNDQDQIQRHVVEERSSGEDVLVDDISRTPRYVRRDVGRSRVSMFGRRKLRDGRNPHCIRRNAVVSVIGDGYI